MLLRVEQVQVAFTVLLVSVLAGSVLCFVVIGWAQHARRKALARAANGVRMHFSPEDPFGLVRRYADFALIVGGHSARANNVTYGRLEGCPVRAFDFRFEVAHGTRRQTRRYSVLAIEMQPGLPGVLMWTDAGWESSPLSALRCDRRVGFWSYRGGEELARGLAGAREDTPPRGAGMEVRGSVLLAWTPATWWGGAKYAIGPDDATGLLNAVRPCRESDVAGRDEPSRLSGRDEFPRLGIENHSEG